MVAGEQCYLLTMMPFGYIKLVTPLWQERISEVVVDVFDLIIDYHEHENHSFNLDEDDVEWGVVQPPLPGHIQQRIKQVEKMARGVAEANDLLGYIEQLNEATPILINGRKIRPMDALGELLAEIERDFDDYLENTGFIKSIWHSIRGKRPWLERKW